MNQNIINKLGTPFPFEAVGAKIQVTNSEKTKGMAVFYLDSRSIQKRLDEIVGAFNWSNHYSSWQNNSQICGISIYNEERQEWITKHDGAENSDVQAIKGGLTDAFKRAAVLWGIGRYLYQMEGVWVEIEQRGKSSYIKDNQQGKLKLAYETAIEKIFGSEIKQQNLNNDTQSNINSSNQSINNQSEQQPPVTTEAPNEQSHETTVTPDDYVVRSIKKSGKTSYQLELSNADGKLTSGYIRSVDQRIVVGTSLRNVQLQENKNAHGVFNIISAYEVCAA